MNTLQSQPIITEPAQRERHFLSEKKTTPSMWQSIFAQLASTEESKTRNEAQSPAGERQRIYSEVLLSPPTELPKVTPAGLTSKLCPNVEPFVPSSAYHTSDLPTTTSSYHGSALGEPIPPANSQCGSITNQQFEFEFANDSGDENFASNNYEQPTYRIKEKTEICKNWQLDMCRFGDRCAFAHGEHQIVKKQHVAPRYKVTKCRSFHTEQVCMYGIRCQFAHLAREKFEDYESILSENARQMAIRISGVAKPDLTHFNVVAPKLQRLSCFKDICREEKCQDTRGGCVLAEQLTKKAKQRRGRKSKASSK